jgi:hypothetical protein
MSVSLTDELRHLDHAEIALVREFPSVPVDVVHALVVRIHRVFSEASVRDYVPLLVQREVRSRLRRHEA